VLVRATEEGALVIGQLSHAWIAGQLARAWGNERVPGAEPFEEVVLGAEQHDIGWSSFDLQPPLNRDTGLPRNFLELSVEEHLAIWRAAPERLLSQSAHAALVVSMHGSSLSQLRLSVGAGDGQAQALRAHVDEEHERQTALRRALRVSEAQAERTRRQMWAWDGLSLALCMGWRPFTSKDVPARDGLIDIELRDAAEGGSTLDPWPFAAERLGVRCEARELTQRYDDEDEMHRALAQARPRTLTFALAPG
jgi:hypothetical protein